MENDLVVIFHIELQENGIELQERPMEFNVILFKEMWIGISIFLLFVFFLNKMPVFREALSTKTPTWKQKVLFILVFSFIGLCGLYWNVPMEGGLINFRSVGPIVGGIIGGPVVGTVAGIVVGGCRVLIYHTPANEIHGITTLIQGIAAGILSQSIKCRSHMWFFSLCDTILIELGSVIFLFTAFHPSMMEREKILATLFPIVITNSVAVSLFIGVLEDSLALTERISSLTAKMAFRSVNLMIHSVQSGLSEKNLRQISDIIIHSLPNITALSLTSEKTSILSMIQKNVNKEYVDKVLQTAHEDASMLSKRYIWFSQIKSHDHVTAEIIAIKAKGNPLTHFEIEFLTGIQELIRTIDLFTRLKKEEEMLKEAEIRMLQAQINPHFLFNTLNTINYYCMADPDTAMNLIGYLSDYYRYSLSNPASKVPVSEEIEDIKAYVNLEKARFSDRMQVVYKIPENIQIKIPPLLLQPLVENAIEHGICASPKGGRIEIGIREHPTYYKFYVLDNGIGMDKETVSSLLVDTGERKRIGLINVHQRLLSIYGPYSGLRIHSHKNKGTLVSFSIMKGEQ